MADGSTTNYAFVLPEVGASQDTWGTKLNQNWTDLDADLDTLQSAVDLKAPLASPALTGTPTAPTAAADTNTTQIATTAYVQTELADYQPAGSYQPLDSDLTAIAALANTNGNFIVGNGSTWVAESGSTARASLGLGTLATLSTVNAATITDNSVGAAELNVSGNGTAGQFLQSDGDGTMTWASVSQTDYIPSGSLMLFQQTAAPTGWTKQTTHNDKALRVVSGTASSGGSSAFTTAFGTPSVSGTVNVNGAPAVGNLAVSISGNVSSTTLSTNTIPSHSHGVVAHHTSQGTLSNNASGWNVGYSRYTQAMVTDQTNSTGNNGAHNHGHNIAGNISGAPAVGNLGGTFSSGTAAINVQYVDLIIASKD